MDTMRGIGMDEAMTRTSGDDDGECADDTCSMLTRRWLAREARRSSAEAAAVVGTETDAASDAAIRRSFFVAGPSLFVDEFEFAATMSAGRVTKDCPTGSRERMRFFDMFAMLLGDGGDDGMGSLLFGMC